MWPITRLSMFDDMVNSSLERWQDASSFGAPEIECRDSERRVYLDIPGVKKEDVKVSVERGLVRVQAERKDFVKTKYDRTFAIGKDFDADNVSAEVQDGVLILTLPLLAGKTKRVLTIK